MDRVKFFLDSRLFWYGNNIAVDKLAKQAVPNGVVYVCHMSCGEIWSHRGNVGWLESVRDIDEIMFLQWVINLSILIRELLDMIIYLQIKNRPSYAFLIYRLNYILFNYSDYISETNTLLEKRKPRVWKNYTKENV